MTRQHMVEYIAQVLQTADDKDQGRHLALFREASDWRIGYEVPTYTQYWSEGLPPSGWMMLDWLTADGQPCIWRDVAGAARVAMDIRAAVLATAQITKRELFVVVAPD